MKKFLIRVLSYPRFLDCLLYAGKYAAVVQLLAAFVFLGFSRCGAPVGLLTYAEGMREAALTTMTLTVGFAAVARIMERHGVRFGETEK